MIFLLIGGMCLGFAVYFAADAATAPARQQELAVRRASRYGIARLRGVEAPRLHFRERVLAPAVQRLAAAFEGEGGAPNKDEKGFFTRLKDFLTE